MATVQRIPHFNSYFDDWYRFIEQVENYFQYSDITDKEKQKYLLLNSLQEGTYGTLRTICYPNSVKSMEYGDLCKILENQFGNKSSMYKNRIEFYRSEQNENETIDEWWTRLKSLSIGCQFGLELGRIILDQFITGLKPSPILERMLHERVPITIEEALDLAKHIESSIAIAL